MQLIYSNSEETTIVVTLAEGDVLDDLVGPTVAYVSIDPGNRHYAIIVEKGLSISPYVAPAQPMGGNS